MTRRGSQELDEINKKDREKQRRDRETRERVPQPAD